MKQGDGLGNSTSKAAEVPAAHGRASASGAARALTSCAFVPRAFASHAFAPRAGAPRWPRVGRPAVARPAVARPSVGVQTAGAQVSQAGKVVLSSDRPCTCRGDHAAGRRSRRLARRPGRARLGRVAVIAGQVVHAHVGRGQARWVGMTTSLTLAGRRGRSACRRSDRGSMDGGGLWTRWTGVGLLGFSGCKSRTAATPEVFSTSLYRALRVACTVTRRCTV